MPDEKALLQPKNKSPPNGKSMNTNDANKTLFWFCLLWNVVYLIGSIISFFDITYRIPHAATIIYLSLVGSYTLHNEINRWNGKLLTASRPGQVIFWIWMAVAGGMVVVQYLTKWKYTFKEEMLEFTLGLVAIFAGNEISKIIRLRNDNGSSAK